MCKDSEEIIKVLKSLLAPADPVSSLNQAVFNREQQDGDTLADYSRMLMRMYARMEQAAVNDENQKEIKHLKDTSLKERFVRSGLYKHIPVTN